MFHLQTGVHLEEVEVPFAIDDEFHGACGCVAHSLGQSDRLFAHCLAGFLVEERRRSLFDHFLVTTLDRTLTLVQVNGVAMAVSENLNFDVARLGDEFLDKDTVVAERVRRFVLGGLEPFAGFGVVPCDAHTLTTATSGGFDHDRITDLVRNFDGLFGVLDQTHVTRNGVHLSILSDLFRRDLVAHRFDCANRRPNEGNASSRQGLSKFRVLREEAIARVHCFGAGCFDRFHDLVDHDVGLVRGRRADVVGFVRHLHMQGVTVSVRIDSNRFDAHLAGGLDDTACDLATVGDQDLLEHVLGSFECKTAVGAQCTPRRFRWFRRPEGQNGLATDGCVVVARCANERAASSADDRIDTERICRDRASGSAGKPTFEVGIKAGRETCESDKCDDPNFVDHE